MKDDEVIGFFLARRFARPWRGRARTRPKMPSGPWRVAAIVVTAIGVVAGLAVAELTGWHTVRCGVVGAALGFVVGIYLVETVWERRVAELGESGTDGPIGPRH